jgi:sulfite reductase (NADPH) hemoprotein beta-component
MTEITAEELSKRVEVERIKDASNYLRGSLVTSLTDPLTGALAESDTQLSKFHGIYQQDDRELRDERRKQKLEPHYQFMVRVRVAGGICSAAQWLDMDRIANTWCNGSIRLTTRQALQFHGILKRNLKQTIADINEALLDTIAACGDVNRNVMCTALPEQSKLHEEVFEYARRINEHFTPQTRAYHEIWLDEKQPSSTSKDVEPIYGKHYLPRKFKTAIAIPPHNDVDIFANDMGFIAIVENDHLVGFNVTVGGGLSLTHGDTATYPRLADIIGYCPKNKTLQVAEEIIKIQRDVGDRTNRKHARLKYTIDDRGIDWFKFELNQRLGWKLEPPRDYRFIDSGDRYGWQKASDHSWNYTLFVQNGRIKDTPDYPLMTGLREIAKIHDGDFRISPNQNLIIARVSEANKDLVDDLLQQYSFVSAEQQSAIRINSMACVAFPTCALAMAESERYLPGFIDRFELLLQQLGLQQEPILLRMTGCPNGCARPFLGEIGLVGKAPGKYNLYLGAGFYGQRLNKLYRENINEKQIFEALTPILQHFANDRLDEERFGDFAVRNGYVENVLQGRDFHN